MPLEGATAWPATRVLATYARHRIVRQGRFVIQYPSNVDLAFAESAFKHGVTKSQIEFVVAHCGLVFDEPALPGSSIPDDRSLYLGDDQHGAALEVVAIALDGERLLVVHAMTLRAAYREQFNEALPHRRLA